MTRGELIQNVMHFATKASDDHGFMRVVLNGADLWLPAATIRTMSHCLHMDDLGRFSIEVERAHFDWMAAQLTQGAHFIDVGSATGAVCLPFAKRFGQSIKITAFEPACRARALLNATLARNNINSIQVIASAVSDKVGTAEFFEYDHDETGELPFLPEASSLAPNPVLPRPAPVSVPVTTLDHSFAQLISAPQHRVVVKIDVEGLEASVLVGATQFISALRPYMAIDIHNRPVGDGTTEEDVAAILSPLGYKLDRLAHVMVCTP